MEFCAGAGTSEAWLWNRLSSLWAEVYGEMIKLFGEKAQTRWSPEKPESRGLSSGVRRLKAPLQGEAGPRPCSRGHGVREARRRRRSRGRPGTTGALSSRIQF